MTAALRQFPCGHTRPTLGRVVIEFHEGFGELFDLRSEWIQLGSLLGGRV